jgi:Alternative complex III, ActD subunit
MKRPRTYGLMAEFDNPTDLVVAARKTYEAGYKKIDAYSPFPIEELSEAIGFHHNGVPLVVLIGGILGCFSGFALQWWIATISYPVNVGGRPYLSTPAFIVVTFEMTILFAVLAALFGMLALNGLPMPYHPVFNVPRFAFATKDRFFLIVFSSDPKYSSTATRDFLESLAPRSISEVPG